MAYPDPYTLASTLEGFSETLIPIPGSDRIVTEPDDRGGGRYPHVRAGVREKYVVECAIDEVTGNVHLAMVDAVTLLKTLNTDWTLVDSAAAALGSGPVSIEVTGDAVQLARITIG